MPAALDLAFTITRPRRHDRDRRAAATHRDVAAEPATLVAEERVLKGSYIGTSVPGRDIPNYIALYQRGLLPVNRLVSGTLALNDINEGFDRLDSGEAIRQVLLL